LGELDGLVIECCLSPKGNGGREVPVFITGLQGSISSEEAEAFIKKAAAIRDIPVLQEFLREHPVFVFKGGTLNASEAKIERRD